MEFPTPTFEELAWFGFFAAFAIVFVGSWLRSSFAPYTKAVRDWYINWRARRAAR